MYFFVREELGLQGYRCEKIKLHKLEFKATQGIEISNI